MSDDLTTAYLAGFHKRDDEVERLTALAYLGEHHHPDLTYKARLDELVPQYRALEAEVERLQARERELEAARIAYASEFDGDVGSIHENIRKMKARVRELEAALRDIASYAEDDGGCCPYGCDTPTIAKAALAAVSEETP